MAIAFLLLLLSFGSIAQTGTIKGQINDDNSEGLEFVNILLLSASDSSLIKGNVTDLNGKFLIQSIVPGSYLVQASIVGYNDFISDVIESKNDEVVSPPFILTTGVALEEVTVKANKPFVEMQADKVVVNVENSGVNAGNTALEVLAKSPGVIVDKGNNITLRGKQGVLVTIDGKQQYMSAQDIAIMLESMPAENINSLEIIMNPSAKYDAEGNSGIINIKLRKNENLGTNGNVSTMIRQGIKFSTNNSVGLNMRTEKVNLYANVNRWDWGWAQELHLNRIIPNDEGTSEFDQFSEMDRAGTSHDIKLGLDYNISPKTTIGLLGKYNNGVSEDFNDNMTQIMGQNLPAFSFLNVVSESNNDRDQYSFNANVKHEFDDKGTELTFDTDYSIFDSPRMNLYNNFFMDDIGDMVQEPYYLRNNQNTSIDIFAAKLDFSKSLESRLKIDIGTKYSNVSTDNVTTFESKQEGVWTEETNRSNSFNYDEEVLAGYAMLSKTLGKFNVQAGLRVEHTLSTGNSITLDQIVDRKYTDFFPSLNISHTVGEKHNLSYSYSRRLNRPDYDDLNPFVEFLDLYTFEKGNPFLNPQYADAFGVNYGFGNNFFISANYSYTRDAITQVIEQISEENLSFQTIQNLDNQESISLTFSMPKVWTEWYTTRLSATSFYNEFKSVIPSGILDNKNLAYQLYLCNNFTLPNDWSLEVTGNYRSPMTYGIIEIVSQYSFDLGLSRSILKGKGNLKIGIDDIFKTRRDGGGVFQ
ncbi:MAG: outer membrane beta-barrel family protein, partial [Saprospiraceae bacterium]|nr:outer membrane beta-barrel family protein [Saprospiraceae bacterium]